MSELATTAPKQLCTFYVDHQLFGVDVTRVQEVIRHQPMTPAPLSPPMVRGLINLRGQIVTAIDLRHRMGLPPLPAEQLPTNVVVRLEEGTVSLLVDAIGDVVVVDERAFEPALETMTADAKALIRGIYKLSTELLLLLDTEAAARIDSNSRT